MRGRLMESFELADDRAISHMLPRDFETLLRELATLQFPSTIYAATLLTSVTCEELRQGRIAWQVGRRLRALRAKTGTSEKEVRQFVEAKREGVRTTRARLTVHPFSTSTVNSEFYVQHGVMVALKTAEVSNPAEPYLVVDAMTRPLSTVVDEAIGWEDGDRVLEGLFQLGASVLSADDAVGAVLAFGALLVHMRGAVGAGKRKGELAGIGSASDSDSNSVLANAADAALGVGAADEMIDHLLVRAMIPKLIAKT
jgi:hypothetical protein